MDATKQQRMIQVRGTTGLSDQVAQIVAALITIGVSGSIAYLLNALFTSWAG